MYDVTCDLLYIPAAIFCNIRVAMIVFYIFSDALEMVVESTQNTMCFLIVENSDTKSELPVFFSWKAFF